MVMEGFSLILKKNIVTNSKFKYHWGFKKLKVTCLSFADDLLVVFYGSEDSVKVSKDSLTEFSNYSGLGPNLAKSSIFFGSVPTSVKNSINFFPF